MREKKDEKKKKKVIQFLFFSFFPSLLIFLLTACSLHFDIIIAFSFPFSSHSPLFFTDIRIFFLHTCVHNKFARCISFHFVSCS